MTGRFPSFDGRVRYLIDDDDFFMSCLLCVCSLYFDDDEILRNIYIKTAGTLE